MLNKKKRVLICPLDWGLGHATRLIPVIYYLQQYGFEVIVAADNLSLQLLRTEFPALSWIQFPSDIIHYSKGNSQVFKIFISIPRFLVSIVREHQQLKRIIRQLHIDIVISDNRYGLWNRKVKSVFITHQLMIKMPPFFSFFEKYTNSVVRWFANKYDFCWIPDLAGTPNLSGDLSHKYKLPVNANFIGILSRFMLTNIPSHHSNFSLFHIPASQYDVVVILSGPEPQRTMLETIITKQLESKSLKSIIVKGKPSELKTKATKSGNQEVVEHLPIDLLKAAINEAKFVICRSGYSSIMDLVSLQKPAILIPTPGQTEQEYLADYLSNNNWFYCVSQNKFNIEVALQKAANLQAPDLHHNNHELLKQQIICLL